MASRSSPLLVNFGPGVSPQGQEVKNFANTHLIDCLCVRAEILQYDGEAPAGAGLRQVW